MDQAVDGHDISHDGSVFFENQETVMGTGRIHGTAGPVDCGDIMPKESYSPQEGIKRKLPWLIVQNGIICYRCSRFVLPGIPGALHGVFCPGGRENQQAQDPND